LIGGDFSRNEKRGNDNMRRDLFSQRPKGDSNDKKLISHPRPYSAADQSGLAVLIGIVNVRVICVVCQPEL
jgi:hypothetical protein